MQHLARVCFRALCAEDIVKAVEGCRRPFVVVGIRARGPGGPCIAGGCPAARRQPGEIAAVGEAASRGILQGALLVRGRPHSIGYSTKGPVTEESSHEDSERVSQGICKLQSGSLKTRNLLLPQICLYLALITSSSLEGVRLQHLHVLALGSLEGPRG